MKSSVAGSGQAQDRSTSSRLSRSSSARSITSLEKLPSAGEVVLVEVGTKNNVEEKKECVCLFS
jgi:hypothetical protein